MLYLPPLLFVYLSEMSGPHYPQCTLPLPLASSLCLPEKRLSLLRDPVRNTIVLSLDPNHNETTGSSPCGHWVKLNSQISFLGHIDTQQRHNHLVLIHNLKIFNHHSVHEQYRKNMLLLTLDWGAWWTSITPILWAYGPSRQQCSVSLSFSSL